MTPPAPTTAHCAAGVGFDHPSRARPAASPELGATSRFAIGVAEAADARAYASRSAERRVFALH
jgi:hypothetical protein